MKNFKFILLSFVLIAFCFVNLYAQDENENLSKKQKRAIMRKIRSNEISFNKTADTIIVYQDRFIERKIPVEVEVLKIVPNDTCIKERYELRHDRRTQQAEYNYLINLKQKEIESLKISSHRLSDSLNEARRMLRITQRIVTDTVSVLARKQVKISNNEVKEKRIEKKTDFGTLKLLSYYSYSFC